MNALLVSSHPSEMSHVAPGRIAYTRRSELAGYPDMTYSSPCAAIGLGTAKVDIPWSSHSSVPLTSYDLTQPVAAVTISVRRSFFHTSGVVQLLCSFRSLRQTWLPVPLSKATMNDC